MARSVEPFIDVYGACLDTGAVGYADVKVDAYVRSPYPQLSWSVKRAPDCNVLELADLLPLGLEADIYRAVDLGIAVACAG